MRRTAGASQGWHTGLTVVVGGGEMELKGLAGDTC